MGHVQDAVKAGLMHPAHGRKHMAELQGHIDSYTRAKRSAAVAASRPNFGSLGSDSVDDSVARSGVASNMPGASAIGTTRSPFDQDDM
jgi:hypothetical protein